MKTPTTTISAWKRLSSVNCSDHIEKKGNLSYLSWAWAWATLCDHFPESTFEFEKTDTGSEFWPFPDGSGEVRCSLTVDGITRTCWLPVMDYKNKAIPNPNARDVNDAKMRCLVKAIALFGLGLYIYAGEDIPSSPPASAVMEEEDRVKPPASESIKEGKVRQSTKNPLPQETESWKEFKLSNGKFIGKTLGELVANELVKDKHGEMSNGPGYIKWMLSLEEISSPELKTALLGAGKALNSNGSQGFTRIS